MSDKCKLLLFPIILPSKLSESVEVNNLEW